MGAKTLEKPRFKVDQIVKASTASKNFGLVRSKARIEPILITDNGAPDIVMIGYDLFEELHQRLEKEEARVLEERIERLEKDPSKGIPWRSIRRPEA